MHTPGTKRGNVTAELRFQDTETARLIQLATDSQSINYPPARKIGLVGDSAVGGSETLILTTYSLSFTRQEHTDQRTLGFVRTCVGGLSLQ